MIRIMLLSTVLLTLLVGCCDRRFRTAQDITPGNPSCEKLDWRYGANDIKIQTTKVTRQLMDRWFAKTGFECQFNRPRLIITDIDNRTNCYIATDMIRDIIEGVAVNDGRFTVVVGDYQDEEELDYIMNKVLRDPKYQNSSRLNQGNAIAPQFLAKVRITKSVTSDRFFDYENYRMTILLYDIETQEVIDSAWDVLTKKVRA